MTEVKEEYYKPGQIKYNKEQIEWLIRNVLFHDQWPSDPKETGYSGGMGKINNTHANFESIRMIIGELNARLKLCGKAGLYLEYITLIDYADREYLIDRLASYNHTTQEEVTYLSNMAMRFCKRKKRKLIAFDMYCVNADKNDKRYAKNKWGG